MNTSMDSAIRKHSHKVIRGRICLSLICAAILFCIAGYLYVWVYDASRPSVFRVDFHMEHLKNELEKLEQDSPDQSVEIDYHKSGVKARLQIHVKEDEEPPLSECKNWYPNGIESGIVQYFEFDTASPTAVLVDMWTYYSMKDAFDGTSPLYEGVGWRYRYTTRIIVSKWGKTYWMRVFANKPVLSDEMITEFVTQANG